MSKGNGGGTCGALLKQCRNCKRKYSATERGVAACPECGTPRGRCQSNKVFPNGRCKLHGGMTPAGIAANNYQGKGYSKYLPQRVKDDYQQALIDPSLIELQSELALIEARMADVLRQLDTGESGNTWRAAQQNMRELLIILQTKDADPQAQAQALNALRRTIDQGAGNYAMWEEVRTLIDAKRRLVETETRRAVSSKMYLTLDRAGLLIDALILAVTDNVTDRNVLARIQREWIRVIGTARQSPLSGGDSGEFNGGASNELIDLDNAA